MAQCNNSVSTDIAYTSFETAAKGNWSYAGAPVNNPAGITGTQSYNLASGAISKTGLRTTGSYIVSYWSKNGQYTVSGTSTTTIGRSSRAWVYNEHLVVNPAGGVITVSGTGIIDELRLYPSAALMNSYTYNSLIGVSSQCDANNHISYYEYDGLNRLMHVRDQDSNLVRKIEYKYQQAVPYPFSNTSQSVTFTRNNCAAGYQGSSITTSIGANVYGSFISVADANQQALNYLNQNFGQAYANLNGACIPFYQYTPCCSYISAYSNFALTGTGSVNFSLVVYNPVTHSGTGKIGTLSGILFIPSVTRTVTVTFAGSTWTMTFLHSGEVDISGPNITSPMTLLSGTYAL